MLRLTSARIRRGRLTSKKKVIVEWFTNNSIEIISGLLTFGGLGEFWKVMQTLDYVSGLPNCLEFSQPSSCLDEAM